MIDENKLIDDLQEKVFHNATDEFYGAMQCIDEQPQLNQWHVVSDGDLPKEYGNYMVCFNGYEHIAIISFADGWNCSVDYDGEICRDSEMYDISAWLELPQPYKERD